MCNLAKDNDFDDLIPISAIQHVLYCRRRYALVHLEQLWAENRFTAEGEVLHERVHRERHEVRKLFREEYGMPVRSLEWGLTGKCDLVEIWHDENKTITKINPVEFKRGREKLNNVDRVQLCAQAICLEEMFKTKIENGQLYYFTDHRRKDVALDESLRSETADLIEEIRMIINSKCTPRVLYEKKKCDNCSLLDLCMPKSTGAKNKSVMHYIQSETERD